MEKLKIMESDFQRILKKSGVKTRPGASCGIWMTILLPTSIFMCTVKYENTLLYNLCGILNLGVLQSTILTPVTYIHDKNTKWLKQSTLATLTLLTTILFYSYLGRGFLFSVISSYYSVFMTHKAIFFILETFPLSFTYGEATIAAQSFVFISYSTVLNVYLCWNRPPVTAGAISSLLLQLATCTIFMLCFLVYNLSILRKPVLFCLTLGICGLFGTLLPLHLLMRKSPVLWILYFVFEDLQRIYLILYWIICSVVAFLFVNYQIKKDQHANSAIRKLFHLIAVVVYIPGLIKDCSLLYLASGLVFVLFSLIEVLRTVKIPPFHSGLNAGFEVFADEKDAGLIALTPIYLLVGFSLPLWLHTSPCDVTNSAGFNLLPLMSGVLSIGVGDTAASICGTYFGKHYWSNSKKTIEGTIACCASQFLVMFLLMSTGYIVMNQRNVLQGIFAIIFSSAVEAKTDQIDNLALPFITYIILLM